MPAQTAHTNQGITLDLLIFKTYTFAGYFCCRQLDQNEISALDANSFQYLTQLRNLRLEGNNLHKVPSEALFPLTSLEAL